MVFANNTLILKHTSGVSIEFIAMDALKLVQNGKQNLKIACSNEWKEARYVFIIYHFMFLFTIYVSE